MQKWCYYYQVTETHFSSIYLVQRIKIVFPIPSGFLLQAYEVNVYYYPVVGSNPKFELGEGNIYGI